MQQSITCARYYDYKTSCFCTLFNKNPSISEQVCDFFVTKFQNHGNEHDHGLLWIKDTPICGINTNEEINFFVNRYISSDVSYYQLHYKMHNNINTLEHVRKQSCCL